MYIVRYVADVFVPLNGHQYPVGKIGRYKLFESLDDALDFAQENESKVKVEQLFDLHGKPVQDI